MGQQFGHRAAASLANSSMVNSSGSSRLGDVGALEDAVARPLGERTAQHLASLPKDVRMTSKSSASLTSAGSTRTAARRTIATSADSTLGRGEDRRTDLAHHAGVGEVLEPQRGRAVGLVAGVRREALPDLLLHHDEHPSYERLALEQVQDQRRGDVVGQVRHDHGLATVEDRGVVGVQRVGVMDRHPPGFDDRTQRLEQVAIDLHRVHLGAGLDQRQRQRSETGADLEHQVALAHVGQARDPSHGVGVDDEVLTEGARWFETVFVKQRPEFGAGMGHQLTLTTMTPLASGANSANCWVSRSTTRSPWAASRSDAMQCTTRPVARSRIVMRVLAAGTTWRSDPECSGTTSRPRCGT